METTGARVAWCYPAGWMLVATAAAVMGAALFFPDRVPFDMARYLAVALMSLFALVHGAQCYGWRCMIFYFGMASFVAFVCETTSVATGFPFGHYQHTSAMGMRLFGVPLLVGPIFAAIGYLGWMLSRLLLDGTRRAVPGRLDIATPLVAAFIATQWDLCIDPVRSTVFGDWIWPHGGAFFGVPWTNFAGWLFTTWLFFQIFAAFLARSRHAEAQPRPSAYWFQVVVFYGLIALEFPVRATLAPAGTSASSDAIAWPTRNLFESMAVVSLFTMLFVVLLSTCVLLRAASTSRNRSD